MGKAVCSEIGYVTPGNPPGLYHSVWELLNARLFGAMPPGLLAQDNLPNVDIWKDGVVRNNDSEPYSFTIVTSEEDVPKKDDVILYKGKYYVIGAVDANNE